MLMDILAFLQSSQQLVADRIEQHIALRSQPSQVSLAKWRDDDLLKTIVTDLKSQSQIIAHSCVKLSLLYTAKSVKVEAADSLLKELMGHMQVFLNIYLKAIDCGLAICMFDYLSQAVKTMLVHVQELLQALANGNKDAMKYITGMIDRIAEELQKLPLINKAAYRRFIMEKCVAIKETLEEFDGYVKSAKESWENGDGEDADEALAKQTEKLTVEDVDDDEEEEEEEEEDREYTKEEVLVVEPSVELLRLALDVTKTTLSVMTSVADKVVAASSSGSAASEEDSAADDYIKKCQYWVATLTQLTATIESDVIDFGSELYPPIVTGEDFDAPRQQLMGNVQKCIASLQDAAFSSHLDESQGTAIQSLQTKLSSLSI